MSIKGLAVAAMLWACGSVAHAQYEGIYFGAGAGPSKARQPADCSPPAGFVTTSCDIEDKKSGWKLFLGYQVNPNLAFEAGYADLGKFKTSMTWSFVVPSPPTNVDASFHPTILGADLVGTLPIGGGFGLLGRIGYFHWSLRTIVSSPSLPGIIEPFNERHQGYNVDFGFGAKWDFAKNLGARLEYQRFRKIGDEDLGKSDVDLLSASLLYRF